MEDGPRRSRVVGALLVASQSAPSTPKPRKHTSSEGGSATDFSLALFHEKYAESLAFVSPAEFRFWWVASVLLHIGCAVFLVQIGRLYLYLPTKPVMWFFELYSVSVDTSYFTGIAAAYFCGASAHFVMLSTLVAHSIRQRRLAFRGVTSAVAPAPTVPDVGIIQTTLAQGEEESKSTRAVCIKCWRVLRRYLIALMNAFSIVLEAFDIRSKYYGVTWVAMEVTQTLLQTYQAFRLSALMPRLWMTNVVVALIVLNCWVMTIVARFFRSETTHARLYGFTISLLLDLVSYILVPVLVFLPYHAQYNRDVGDFGDVYWYNDVWLVRMINELRLLFVVSLFDGVSKAMMMLSVPRSLYVLTKLLRERPAKVSASSVRLLARMSRRRATIVPEEDRSFVRQQRRRPTTSPRTSVTAFADSSSPGPDNGHVHESTPGNPSKVKNLRRSVGALLLLYPLAAINSSGVERWGHRFLQLWGAGVLATHLHATTKARPSNCTLHSYPWFVTKPACSLLELDCRTSANLHEHGGDAQVIDEIIQGVDTSLVQHVVIRHCSHLEFPPSIAQLPRLVGLKIRDSTIASWNESASLTQDRHPELRFLFLGNVNMSAMPEGMTAHNFPARLRDIEMCRVNLTALPRQLDEVWPSDMFLLLEQFQFDAFPDVVLKLRANLLSLALNNFAKIPRELLEMASIETLILNGNPLVELPGNGDIIGIRDKRGGYVDVDPSAELQELHLVMTEVEALPTDWSRDGGFLSRALVNAPHTPLCTRLLASEGSAPAHEMYDGATTGSGIDCFDDSRLTWYPINSP